MIKIILNNALALLVFFVTAVSCSKSSGLEEPKEVSVTSITITQESVELQVGETIQLTATVQPSNATNKTITWTSSNQSVATVANGLLTAVGEGTATIIAFSGSKSATCLVTVKAKPIEVWSIELNKKTLALYVGSWEVLTAKVKPDKASCITVTWISSDDKTAAVDANGKVTAIKDGTAIVTAKAGDKSVTCNVTVKEDPGFVDLGLSVKWSTRNLGASLSSDYGDYFAWGETEPYYAPGYAQSTTPVWKSGKTSGYSLSSYKWCKGTYETFTKYNNSSSNGTVDNKTVLETSDDAAHVILGDNWRIPTDSEWSELRTNCTWITTTLNGVNGRLVTSKINGASIFLPAAGYRSYTNLSDVGSSGVYWSSSLYIEDSACSWAVYLESGKVTRDYAARFGGFSIRPIKK